MTKKINSPQDLQKVRDRARADIDLRTGGKDMRLTVHMGTCGIAAGARDIMTALMAELSGDSAAGVSIHQSGCAGLCDKEPMMTLQDASGRLFRYGGMNRAKVRRIVREHVLQGRPVQEYLITP